MKKTIVELNTFFLCGLFLIIYIDYYQEYLKWDILMLLNSLTFILLFVGGIGQSFMLMKEKMAREKICGELIVILTEVTIVIDTLFLERFMDWLINKSPAIKTIIEDGVEVFPLYARLFPEIIPYLLASVCIVILLLLFAATSRIVWIMDALSPRKDIYRKVLISTIISVCALGLYLETYILYSYNKALLFLTYDAFLVNYRISEAVAAMVGLMLAIGNIVLHKIPIKSLKKRARCLLTFSIVLAVVSSSVLRIHMQYAAPHFIVSTLIVVVSVILILKKGKPWPLLGVKNDDAEILYNDAPEGIDEELPLGLPSEKEEEIGND